MNKKIIILEVLGGLFLISGLYFGNITFQYLGLGSLVSGLIYVLCYPRFKEVTSLIIGLLVLHTGVLFILKGNITNVSLFGLFLFIAGIVFVMNSGFSDYMKNRKNN